MTRPRMDEELAWRLVRAVEPGLIRSGPGTVELDDGSGAGIRIERSGAWKASPPPGDAARRLLDLFLPIRLPEALVMAQLAQGLDGRIATEEGHSHYVSGPEDLRRLHRLRALVDAVVVGAGTADLDDPRLTVRHVEGANPARVILDPSGRVDPGSRVFSDGAAPTWLIGAGRGDEGGDDRSEEGARSAENAGRRGVRRILLPHDPDRGFEPGAVVSALRARGMQRILVEGGGVTVSRFLEAGLLDRLHLTVAPLLIGSGRPGITLPPVASLDDALRPPCRHFLLGQDVLFDLDLRGGRSGESGRRAGS